MTQPGDNELALARMREEAASEPTETSPPETPPNEPATEPPAETPRPQPADPLAEIREEVRLSLRSGVPPDEIAAMAAIQHLAKYDHVGSDTLDMLILEEDSRMTPEERAKAEQLRADRPKAPAKPKPPKAEAKPKPEVIVPKKGEWWYGRAPDGDHHAHKIPADYKLPASGAPPKSVYTHVACSNDEDKSVAWILGNARPATDEDPKCEACLNGTFSVHSAAKPVAATRTPRTPRTPSAPRETKPKEVKPPAPVAGDHLRPMISLLDQFVESGWNKITPEMRVEALKGLYMYLNLSIPTPTAPTPEDEPEDDDAGDKEPEPAVAGVG